MATRCLFSIFDLPQFVEIIDEIIVVIRMTIYIECYLRYHSIHYKYITVRLFSSLSIIRIEFSQISAYFNEKISLLTFDVKDFR